MIKRKRINVEQAKPKVGGNYFPDRNIKFISSGCTILDCVLGGGWPLGRIVNIVGDKAVGKTLLAIEACANFHHQYPNGHIWYREAEAAFDPAYAITLGLPEQEVDFGYDGIETIWDTVEDIAEDLEEKLAEAMTSNQPGLYIVDSLDALSSRAELDRKVGDATYGLEKQRLLGMLFRTLARRLKRAQVTLVIVSQIRHNIGPSFSEKYTRTGGKSLDFYSSVILWLHNKGILRQTRKGVERATALRVLAKCKKNKIVATARECEFVLRFGYGVDDLEASVSWLKQVKQLNRIGVKEADIRKYVNAYWKLNSEEARMQRAEVGAVVKEIWQEVEQQFRTSHTKYG